MSSEGFVTGVVKWFDSTKGYGFAVVDGKDIFLHSKRLRGSGCDTDVSNVRMITLDPGVKLRFKIEGGPKGSYATDITKEQ